MLKLHQLAVAAALGVAATLMIGPDAKAAGFGGGFRGGGGGFHGHVGGPRWGGPSRGSIHARHGVRHGPGFHRHGWHRRHGGRGYGYGGVPLMAGYGYGGPGGYDDGPRSRREPSYGIPPSPVLPPAIYVIGPKAGTASRASGPAVRKARSSPVLTSGSGPTAGGSSASVIERRHRMN